MVESDIVLQVTAVISVGKNTRIELRMRIVTLNKSCTESVKSVSQSIFQ